MEQLQFQFRAMGCPCELRFHSEPGLAQEAAETCQREAMRFEAKYSRYRSESVTSEINRSAGVRPVQLDDETRAILAYADVCYQQSEGLFDITSGVLRQVWQPQRKTLPKRSDIDPYLELIDWTLVGLSGNTVFLPMPGMELDLGGVVKEYAADALAALARARGIQHGFVSLGGDICILGPRPDGSPWPIGVVHPGMEATAYATIELAAGAIATSGGYERFIEIDGRRYSHLMDPRTGWPVDSLLSVSVTAEQCIVAGSVSTIGLLMGAQTGLNWLAKSGAAYLAVDKDLTAHGTLESNAELSPRPSRR